MIRHLTQLALVLVPGPLLCQNTTPVNSAFWPGLELNLSFKEEAHWGLYTEAYYKTVNFIDEPQGIESSIGANYFLKNDNRFTGGFTWAYNYPYDDAALPYSWPDYRIWQQLMIRKPSKAKPGNLWMQRYRLEERWFGRKDTPLEKEYDNYKFEITLRAMVKGQWYVSRRFGLVANDEIHLRVFSEERNEKYLDQNRLYVGTIYALNDARNCRFELGYMHQAQWNSPDSEKGRERINHTVRLTFTADLAF